MAAIVPIIIAARRREFDAEYGEDDYMGGGGDPFDWVMIMLVIVIATFIGILVFA